MTQHSVGNPPRNRKIAKFYYILPFCIFDACFEEFFATDFFVKIKKNYVHTLQLFGSLLFFHAHYWTIFCSRDRIRIGNFRYCDHAAIVTYL